MSNSNTILAFARDTQYSATSYDGTVWSQTDAKQEKWKMLGGKEGKFIYGVVNDTNKLCLVDYAITDNVAWNAGVMPSPQLPCIVAVARNYATLVTSYDGVTFSNVNDPTPVFKVTCLAVSTSVASYVRTYANELFTVTAHAYAFGEAVFERAVTFRRTMLAVATSVASRIGPFVW